MKNTQGAIGIFPAFSIIILSVGLMNHVLVIPPLLEASGRDAWFTVAASTLPYLVWIYLIYYLMKTTKQKPFLLWLQDRYGKALAWSVRICFILYAMLIGSMTLWETTTWTHVSYLPRTPHFVLSLTLLFVCFYAAKYGIHAIAISAGLLLPFVVLFGDFVMSFNLPRKDYSMLFPLFENGFGPVLKGWIYIGGGLAELSLILLIQQHFKKKIKYWHLVLLGIFLALLIFGPVTGGIAEFGPYEAASLRYPAYEEWRLVRIGKYITHVDFLSIYQWLSGAFIRISLAIYILLDLLTLDKAKHRILGALAVALVMFIAVELPISDMQFLWIMTHIYFPISLSLVMALSLGLYLLVFIANRKEGKQGETKTAKS